jgi:hypothetical protein
MVGFAPRILKGVCVSRHRASLVTLSIFTLVLLVGRVAHALDRPPQLLDHRQDAATNKVRLLWAPGGKADGTIDPTVFWYKVERKNPGSSSWSAIYFSDHYAMTYVDPNVGEWTSWTTATQGLPVSYRVAAHSNGAWTYSDPPVSFVPDIPFFPPSEILDGKVLLAWMAAPGSYQSHTLSGYRVQKFNPSLNPPWVEVSGWTPLTSFVDPAPWLGFESQ